MTNREITARLNIAARDRTGRVFDSVASKMGVIEKRAATINRTQNALVQSAMARAAMVARYAVPAAAAAAMVYATKEAANFEESLFGIQKKSGATAEQMEKLKGQIRQLAGEIPVSIDEIASAFERGAASGIPVDELKEFAKLTAGVANAWDTTAEHVGNVFAGFTAGLGMARKDLQAYASLINDLADSGIADETDIADFIDRAGASLKNFGMTPEQIAAYGAALLNLKMPAEVGARAMDTLTGKLFAPENLSPKSFGALKNIVGDVKEFTKLSGNAKLMFFLGKLEKLSAQQRASYLGALLGEGFDDEIMRLVAGTAELRRNLDLADRHVQNPSNSIIQTQAKSLELFNSQLAILQNNLKNIAIEAGEATVLPWLNDAMKKANQILSDMEAQKQAIAKMIPGEEGPSRQKFFEDWKKNHPDAWFGNSQAWDAYGAALARVGRGEIVDVHAANEEESRKLRGGGDYLDESKHPRGWPRDQMEFPGGGGNYTTKNLPLTGPVPGSRPVVPPWFVEQYQQYAEGRSTIASDEDQKKAVYTGRRAQLRNADPKTVGMGDLHGPYLVNGQEPKTVSDGSFGKTFRIPSKEEWQNALDIDIDSLKKSGDEAGQKVAEGGQQAGESIKESAAFVKVAGVDVAAAIRDAAAQLAAAARGFNTALANSTAAGRNPKTGEVNANLGLTMPPSAGQPAGSGGGGGGF